MWIDGQCSCWPRTIKCEQRRKIPAVVNSCRVRRTGHPQVFVDGRCGDNITIHCGDLPVSIWEGDPNHQPTQKPQKEGKSFHYCIHASLLPWLSCLMCSFVGPWVSVCWTNCDQLPSYDATEVCKLMINSESSLMIFPIILSSGEAFQRLQVFTKLR